MIDDSKEKPATKPEKPDKKDRKTVKTIELPPKDLVLKKKYQSREKIDLDTVKEYAEAMEEGASFPAIVVFLLDGKYVVVDGFHRTRAARKADLTEIAVEVHPGGEREARQLAAKANATHGLRRTNADKRRVVTWFLKDKEWEQWSNGEIARACGVSDVFVGKLRKKLTPNGSESPKRKSRRNGKQITMETGNIGPKKGSKSKKANKADPEQEAQSEQKPEKASEPATQQETSETLPPEENSINDAEQPEIEAPESEAAPENTSEDQDSIMEQLAAPSEQQAAPSEQTPTTLLINVPTSGIDKDALAEAKAKLAQDAKSPFSRVLMISKEQGNSGFAGFQNTMDAVAGCGFTLFGEKFPCQGKLERYLAVGVRWNGDPSDGKDTLTVVKAVLGLDDGDIETWASKPDEPSNKDKNEDNPNAA